MVLEDRLVGHRSQKLCALGSLGFLVLGFVIPGSIADAVLSQGPAIPSYADVWLPEDAPLAATDGGQPESGTYHPAGCRRIRPRAQEARGGPEVAHSFVGGGGPRFWLSATPEARQPELCANRRLRSTTSTTRTIWSAHGSRRCWRTYTRRASIFRQLETGKPIGIPVQIRLMGDDIPTLRSRTERLKAVASKGSVRFTDPRRLGRRQLADSLHAGPGSRCGRRCHRPGPAGEHRGRSGRISGYHFP